MTAKLKIVMLYDSGIKVLGDLSASVAEEYCVRHDYAFACYRELLDPSLHPSWNKLLAIQAELESCDWLLWLDADAIIVDLNYKLETLIPRTNSDIAMSWDASGICAGIFLIRNCLWSKSLLQALLFLGDVNQATQDSFNRKPKFEQNTLKVLQQNFPNVTDKISVIPESIIANPRSESINPEFIMHLWGSSGDMVALEARMRSYLKRTLPQ